MTLIFIIADSGNYNPSIHTLDYIIDINDTHLLIPKVRQTMSLSYSCFFNLLYLN